MRTINITVAHGLVPSSMPILRRKECLPRRMILACVASTTASLAFVSPAFASPAFASPALVSSAFTYSTPSSFSFASSKETFTHLTKYNAKITSAPFKILRHSLLPSHAQRYPTSLFSLDEDNEDGPGYGYISLLGQVNLDMPYPPPEYHSAFALPLYVNVLGCGIDPSMAGNVEKGLNGKVAPDGSGGTFGAVCGPSKFQLLEAEKKMGNYDKAQVVPGAIGLAYKSLEPLKERLRKIVESPSSDSTFVPQFEISIDNLTRREFVRVDDPNGNIFYCREEGDDGADGQIFVNQPILSKDCADHRKKFPRTTEAYGIENGATATDCVGISYVEFRVPRGSAEKIAEFYRVVLGAASAVVESPGGKEGGFDAVAVVACGTVKEDGRPAQSLLFRESDEDIPPSDGHHVTLYVGDCAKDYEDVFANCHQCGVVWINQRFSDKTENLSGARKWKQFRFKDILDLETGEKIFELEHEMRSIEHSAFPGYLP